jgi:hypothetical protein
MDPVLNYLYKLEIDITPLESSATWAALEAGFSNLSEALNEVLYQAAHFGNGGWGSTDVTGGQYTATLTGVRVIGDLAQDYIFSDNVRYAFGASRKTTLRVSRSGVALVEWGITLANITQSGGDANKPANISLAIHGNGAPILLTDTYLEPLKVVSVAGSSAGDTAIYVNPEKEEANSYKYKVGNSVDLPLYDAALTTGWTSWNGSAEITAETGQEIVIAEVVTSTSKARKAGKATVTAATE